MITNSEYRNAATIVGSFNRANDAFVSIDPTGLTSDERVKLSEFSGFFSDLKNKYQTVIDQGDKSYEERPKKLISAVIHRFNKIDPEILATNKAFQGRLDDREAKIEELRKQRFTTKEIEVICPSVTEADHEALTVKITSLQTEQEKLKAFIADAPRYDIAILDGIVINEFINGEIVTLNAKN